MTPALIAHLRQHVKDADALLAALTTTPPISIRLNTKKISHIDELRFPVTQPVAWCANAYYLAERPVFTLDPHFQGGGYYVQEASSMFIAHMAKQLLPNRALRVLDLCAAPGGKSTLLLDVLPKGSLLVSNEVVRNRYQVLIQNMQKWGEANVIITNHLPEDFAKVRHFFDVILIDAPCSGEGLFRKDKNAIAEWSPENVQHCSQRQRKILASALGSLRPDGLLMYSTCTYNRHENQENVQWLCKEYPLTPTPVNIPINWQIQYDGGYQFYPHKVQGEGFFAQALQLREPLINLPTKVNYNTFHNLTKVNKQHTTTLHEWLTAPEYFEFYQTTSGKILAVPNVLLPDFIYVEQHLNKLQFALEMGTFKGKDFIPAHALALSTHLSQQLTFVELDEKNALHYLRRQPFDVDAPTGWVVMRYNGIALGFAKKLPNRLNNYFPTEWRVLM